jgi:hypothetical protein
MSEKYNKDNNTNLNNNKNQGELENNIEKSVNMNEHPLLQKDSSWHESVDGASNNKIIEEKLSNQDKGQNFIENEFDKEVDGQDGRNLIDIEQEECDSK